MGKGAATWLSIRYMLVTVVAFSAFASCVFFFGGCYLGWLNWRQVDQGPLCKPPSRSYSGLHFFSDTTGCVWTEDEILYTADAGRHWELRVDFQPLVSGTGHREIEEVFFLSPEVAWAVYGHVYPEHVYRTVDGFRTIEDITDGAEWVRDLVFVDAAHGWGGAEDRKAIISNGVTQRREWIPQLAMTADGGVTWRKVDFPDQYGELNHLVMFSNTEGLADTRKHLLRTTDGGLTWQPIPGAPYYFQALRCAARNLCAALRYTNELLLSADGGETWQPQEVPVEKQRSWGEGRDDIHTLQVVSPSQVVMFGHHHDWPPGGPREVLSHGQYVTPRYADWPFLITYDGHGWSCHDYPHISYITEGWFTDPRHGWAVASDNNIFHTNNGGRSWRAVDDYFRRLPDARRCWFSGDF